MFTHDSQQAARDFLIAQAAHIEAQVYAIQYPEIQYPFLVPVDTSANEWARTITYFSSDRVGAAGWLAGLASDIPLADITRAKHEHTVEMAGIGYRYTLEELGHAMLIPGTDLTSDKAAAARRAYEEFMENLVLRGDTGKGWTGLINDANVSVVAAAADGDGDILWDVKDADGIMKDVNDALTGVYSSSLQVEMADTVLLPVTMFTLLGNTRIPDTTMPIIEYLRRYNTYTAVTGQPLTIRAVRGLETAGVAGVGRMVVYRRDPGVLKAHIPMPHRFLPVWQTGPMAFDVPGIFRTGGVEVRRPGAMRYVDGIMDLTGS